MKKLITCLAMIIAGCQSNLEAIPAGQETYRCEVSDYGQVNCVQEWAFRKAPQ